MNQGPVLHHMLRHRVIDARPLVVTTSDDWRTLIRRGLTHAAETLMWRVRVLLRLRRR